MTREAFEKSLLKGIESPLIYEGGTTKKIAITPESTERWAGIELFYLGEVERLSYEPTFEYSTYRFYMKKHCKGTTHWRKIEIDKPLLDLADLDCKGRYIRAELIFMADGLQEHAKKSEVGHGEYFFEAQYLKYPTPKKRGRKC